jgi:ABC-type nitrate/sulfonate/bicarbonate transport system permease component
MGPTVTEPGPTAPAAPAATRPSAWRWARDPGVPVFVAVLLLSWAVVSRFTPSYVLPGIPAVARQIGQILTTGDLLRSLLTTLARVALGLVSAFAAGSAIGMLMGVNTRVARYLLPPIRFIQGIPSLSWVIMAVIWFQVVELRVWFVMVLITLPGFALQAYDSYRAIPADLRDMARSFRPGRWALFREVTLPAITPGIFTAWKVNLGLAIRMVLIAELVGTSVGVGAQLLSAEQLLDMTAVVAWTLLLAVIMLLAQGGIELLESRALRYRPAAGRPAAARAVPAPDG